MNATETTEAMYGSGGQLTNRATGFMTKFVDPGKGHHTQYIHRVLMTQLKPGNTYCKFICIINLVFFSDITSTIMSVLLLFTRTYECILSV